MTSEQHGFSLPEPPPLPRAVPLPPPIREPVWPVFLVVFLSLVVQVMGLGLIGLVAVLRYPEARESAEALRIVLTQATEEPQAILIGASGVMVGFGVLAVFAASLSRHPIHETLRLAKPAEDAGVIVLAIVGVLSLQTAFIAADELGWLPESSVLQDLSAKLSSLSGPERLWAILVIGIAPGIFEELLFRGYIQTGFRRRWGPWVGSFLAAVLFGICHLDLTQGMFAALMGWYLGLLTERTNSLWPAVLCHATNNTIATVLALGNEQTMPGRPDLVFGFAALIVVVTAWSIVAPMVVARKEGETSPPPNVLP